jgi:hygromycin-B 7''-O-kinase
MKGRGSTLSGAPTPRDFDTLEDYVARRGDVEFWQPYICEILRRHEIESAAGDPEAGYNSSYPTFIFGDVVIKLFGFSDRWLDRYEAERAALAIASSDPAIRAPILIGSGHLYPGVAQSWPYLVTGLVPGDAMWRIDLTQEQRLSLASRLGRTVRRIHQLPPDGIARHEDWMGVDVTTAAERSSLPPHLSAQAEEYVEGLGPFDRVVVNGDIVANHVYVQDNRIVGLIDWGDTTVTDRHIEIIQIFRDVFDCDKAQLGAFLEASRWPVDNDFPRKALGFGLLRQAIGLAQHNSIDVFMPIAEKYPLDDIASIDDLAALLFGGL